MDIPHNNADSDIPKLSGPELTKALLEVNTSNSTIPLVGRLVLSSVRSVQVVDDTAFVTGSLGDGRAIYFSYNFNDEDPSIDYGIID